MKTVIWIIWPIASWKDMVSKYISDKYNIKSYQISSELKEIAKEDGIDINRDNLIILSRKLSSIYGDEYLAKKILENNESKSVIIVWMRQVWQIKYLRKKSNFILIWVNSTSKIRYNRMLIRNKWWDPLNYDEFLKTEKRDDWEWVQKISECMNLCDYMLVNNWTEIDLYREIDNTIKKIDIS